MTLKMPFAGTYNVVFGVETRGGVVYGDTATFKIDDMYAEFVSDPMWTKVAGGAGKSKTWYLDLDADATSRYFLGPIYFFTNTYTWDNLHNAAGENYLDADAWDATKAITPNLSETGTATWYWLADYPGNSWMCDAADFGSMTFDLIGGANITDTLVAQFSQMFYRQRNAVAIVNRDNWRLQAAVFTQQLDGIRAGNQLLRFRERVGCRRENNAVHAGSHQTQQRGMLHLRLVAGNAQHHLPGALSGHVRNGIRDGNKKIVLNIRDHQTKCAGTGITQRARGAIGNITIISCSL